jgi:hypothetical protein
LNRIKELGLDKSLMEALQETLKGRIFTEQQQVSRT